MTVKPNPLMDSIRDYNLFLVDLELNMDADKITFGCFGHSFPM